MQDKTPEPKKPKIEDFHYCDFYHVYRFLEGLRRDAEKGIVMVKSLEKKYRADGEDKKKINEYIEKWDMDIYKTRHISLQNWIRQIGWDSKSIKDKLDDLNWMLHSELKMSDFRKAIRDYFLERDQMKLNLEDVK